MIRAPYQPFKPIVGTRTEHLQADVDKDLMKCTLLS